MALNIRMPVASGALIERGSGRVTLPSPVGAAAAVFLVIVLFGWFQAPLRDEWPPLVAINLAGGALFLYSALLMFRDEEQRGTAALLACAGGSWLIGWIRVQLPGPLPFLDEVIGALFWGFVGWAVLRYPAQRLATLGDRFFVAAPIVAWCCVESEFGEDGGGVCFDGFDAEEELFADAGVGSAFGH